MPPCQADIYASAFGNDLLLTHHERTATASLLALGGTGRVALVLAQHGTALPSEPQKHWLSCLAWGPIQANSQLMKTAVRVAGTGRTPEASLQHHMPALEGTHRICSAYYLACTSKALLNLSMLQGSAPVQANSESFSEAARASDPRGQA